MSIDLRKEVGFDSLPSEERHTLVRERFWAIMETAGLARLRRGDSPDLSDALVVGLSPSFSLYDVKLAECLLEANARGICSALYLFDLQDAQDMEDLQTRFLPGFGPVYHSPVVGIWRIGVLAQHAEGFAAIRTIESALGMKCAAWVPSKSDSTKR